MAHRKTAKKNDEHDLKGKIPESWICIDCLTNTAPGILNRVQLEQAFAGPRAAKDVQQKIDTWSEVYMVKQPVWKAAGMNAGMGGYGDQDGDSGCLCIGCLEKRLGRTLVPKDFDLKHPLNSTPGTKRLFARRNGLTEWVERQPDGSHKLCRVNGSVVEVTDIDGDEVT
jgi:hypothetical protein